MSERLRFIDRLEAGERMVDLCLEYEISRKTAYKFWNRYKEQGARGLYDLSRAPKVRPRSWGPEIRSLLLGIKREHPTWGARKVRAYAHRVHPGVPLPAASTVFDWFNKEGLVTKRRRRRRASPSSKPLAHAVEPNDLWCADFKGQFRTGDGRYCYPLTVTDAVSRKILAIVALESTQHGPVMLVFRELFREHGLPRAIRTDNGAPFASTGLLGLSRLSVFWHSLGVSHERITPGRPQENGSHERMHKTLKEDTARPAGANLLQQQEKFDDFKACFNEQRPHESLGNQVPDDVYAPSTPRWTGDIPKATYPLHDATVRVRSSGHIKIPYRDGRPNNVYLSTILEGEEVGVREMENDLWETDWRGVHLGVVDMATRKFEHNDD